MGNADGFADWVDAWSDHYDIIPRVDACLLGSGMYGGYQDYWTTIRNAPTEPLAMTGKPPTAAEVVYAKFTAIVPHYVLSNTLTTSAWPNTSFLKSVAEVRALKEQPGKDIYLVGGARIVDTLLDEGLVDELTLDLYPLVVGTGKALFEATQSRHALELRNVRQLPDGRVSLSYALGQ